MAEPYESFAHKATWYTPRTRATSFPLRAFDKAPDLPHTPALFAARGRQEALVSRISPRWVERITEEHPSCPSFSLSGPVRLPAFRYPTRYLSFFSPFFLLSLPSSSSGCCFSHEREEKKKQPNHGPAVRQEPPGSGSWGALGSQLRSSFW